MSERLTLQIPKKSTKAYELTFKENGILVDITGWAIYFYCKENMEDEDSDAVIKKTITDHTDAANGKTLIELSSSDTDLLGNYYYSCDYKTADEDEGILFYGKITFTKTVLDTRS